jgi:hypothetical protein
MRVMQVRIEDPAARQALVSALADAGCSATGEGETIVVRHVEPEADERGVSVAFFLRAWQQRHPAVELEVVG